jgi:uncharacterized protein YdhG (YjbR/CyaY superfamily)
MPAPDSSPTPVTTADEAQLARIRAVAKRVVPTPEEGVSYGMPAYFYRGKPFLSAVARKKHLSLYPFSGKVIAQLRDKLAGYELTTGSIHFSSENPIPDALLEEIIFARLREIDDLL